MQSPFNIPFTQFSPAHSAAMRRFAIEKDVAPPQPSTRTRLAQELGRMIQEIRGTTPAHRVQEAPSTELRFRGFPFLCTREKAPTGPPPKSKEQQDFFRSLTLRLLQQQESLFYRLERSVVGIDPRIFIGSFKLASINIKAVRDELDKAIALSISQGDLGRARNLIRIATSVFPGQSHYTRMLDIVSPPTLVRVRDSRQHDFRQTLDFLRKNGGRYFNKWVAISSGTLLEVSDSYAELYRKYRDIDNVVITKPI